MTRVLVALAAVLATGGSLQQPQIQNGRIEHRASSGVARDVAALVAGSSDPLWIAWREPMVEGERSLCCWYNYGYDGSTDGVRGCTVDGNTSQSGPPQLTPPTGPVPLEAGTGVVMLIRAVDKRIERLRIFSDDCLLDAGGRTVYWLDGVPPPDSLKYLEDLSRGDGLNPTVQRSLANEAIQAVALHGDPAADAILDRIAGGDPDSSLRRQAASQLGRVRGAHGFDTLRRLIGTESQADVRRSFVIALGQTRQPRTPDALLALARQDADPKVRAEAVYWYARSAGAAGIADVTSIIGKDADANVKSRAVSGLASMQKDAGVASLIDLARTNTNPSVRKDAITALGRSKDPRAVAYLEEVLRR